MQISMYINTCEYFNYHFHTKMQQRESESSEAVDLQKLGQSQDVIGHGQYKENPNARMYRPSMNEQSSMGRQSIYVAQSQLVITDVKPSLMRDSLLQDKKLNSIARLSVFLQGSSNVSSQFQQMESREHLYQAIPDVQRASSETEQPGERQTSDMKQQDLDFFQDIINREKNIIEPDESNTTSRKKSSDDTKLGGSLLQKGENYNQSTLFNVCQNATNTQQLNAASQPIFINYKTTTNKTNELYEIQFKFNYSHNGCVYFVVNEYQNDVFMLSETAVTIQKHLISNEIENVSLKFSFSDIGSYVHLLIQDGINSFLIPLTSKPVDPSKEHEKLYQHVEQKSLDFKSAMIQVTSNQVVPVNVRFNKQNNLQVKINKYTKLVLTNQEDTDCIHPCYLYYTPYEHPSLFNVMKNYDAAYQQYNKQLTFSLDYFFTDQYSLLIKQRDKQKLIRNEEADYYLLFKQKNQIFVIYFTKKDYRDVCYLSYLMTNKLLFKQVQDKTYSSTRKGQKYQKFIDEQKTNSFTKAQYSFSQQEQQLLYKLQSPKTARVVLRKNSKSSNDLNNKQSSKYSSGDFGVIHGVTSYQYDYLDETLLQIRNNNDIVRVYCCIKGVKTVEDSFAVCNDQPIKFKAQHCFQTIEVSGFSYFSIQKYQFAKQLSLKMLNQHDIDQLGKTMTLINCRHFVSQINSLGGTEQYIDCVMTLLPDTQLQFSTLFNNIKFTAYKHSCKLICSYKQFCLLIYQDQQFEIEVFNEKEFLLLKLFFD